MPRLLPREGKFFDFFNQHAHLATLAAAELKALLEDIADLESRRRNIERYEKQADQVTRQTIALLHQTFITPLDRDEIHQLITRMDDILDLMEDVAQCVFLYDLRVVPEEAKRLADICVACCATPSGITRLVLTSFLSSIPAPSTFVKATGPPS